MTSTRPSDRTRRWLVAVDTGRLAATLGEHPATMIAANPWIDDLRVKPGADSARRHLPAPLRAGTRRRAPGRNVWADLIEGRVPG